MVTKKAKEKAVDLLDIWVIDRSGSMGGMEAATIEGFNGYINQQKKVPGKMWVSLLLFDNQFETPYAALPIEEVPELTHEVYFARGGTALYDAVGVAIRGAEGWLSNNPKFKGKVKITVWTDGYENSSTQWNIVSLMEAIKGKQAQGWIFAFNGSGGAAWTEGKHFAGAVGAVNTTQVNNTKAGHTMTYAVASSATSALRGTTTRAHSAGGAYLANAAFSNTAATMDMAEDFGLTAEDVEEALAGTTNTV